MDHWDEMRTAYAVARQGTVSAAAEELGLHRATVVRHIELLEAALGGRLFVRHARGYTTTEAGDDLFRVARATDEQFSQLELRTRGRQAKVSGEVVVTSVALLSPLVLPALRAFQRSHPEALVRYEASRRVYALEYGEAHVAVRSAGMAGPDNVVQPWLVLRSGLYAHRSYLEERGTPSGPEDFAGHIFIGDGAPDSTAATTRWRQGFAPDVPIAFSTRDPWVQFTAVRLGVGIGFVPERVAEHWPDLVPVVHPRPEWDVPFFLVTHVDLHWSTKVQAVLAALKELGDS